MTDSAIPTTHAANTTLASTRQHRYHAYAAIGLMYFAQGLPAGLAFEAIPALIRHAGHSVEAVGLVGLAFLPWALKFLWASAIDNACKRRSVAQVVAVTQLAAIACCLLMALYSPVSQLVASLVGVVLLNTICATQDIATNAYAVARLQGKTAGTANAITIAAFIVGMVAGGGGTLIVHDQYGWHGAMFGLAALLTLAWMPLLLTKTWRISLKHRVIEKASLRKLGRHKDIGWALLVALLFKFPGTATNTAIKPWLVDQGYSLSAIGGLQIMVMLASAAGGIVIGIGLIRRLGNRRGAATAAILSTLALGIPWFIVFFNIEQSRVVSALLVSQGFLDGALYVAIWALFMNWASPSQPGTDFTALQSSESIANAVAAGGVASIAGSLGYQNAFASNWVIGLVVLIALLFALPRVHPDRSAPVAAPHK